jgi:hypothetical protein
MLRPHGPGKTKGEYRKEEGRSRAKKNETILRHHARTDLGDPGWRRSDLVRGKVKRFLGRLAEINFKT